MPVVSCVAVAMCYCGDREVWSVLLWDSLTRVRRQFVTTPSRLFASGHSFIMSNQEFVDQRLTGRDLWHVAGPCFLLRGFTHLVSTYQLQSCHMALGVLFSVSNLFIKKLWSTVILSHFNALTLLDAQHFEIIKLTQNRWFFFLELPRGENVKLRANNTQVR